MLPVDDDGPWGLKPPGWRRRIKLQEGPLTAGLFEGGGLGASWYHRFKAHQGADIMMAVAGTPLVVTGACGAGRVAVVGATPLGHPGKGQTLIESTDWPRFLARLVAWLAGGAESASRSDADAGHPRGER